MFEESFVGIPAFKFFNHDLPEMFQRFNKQREAFAFFDELPAIDRRNVKLYQVELPSTGTRQFVVCSAKKYLDVYNSIKEAHLRHHYEIIRDGFPCRAYFDLEYSMAENPAVDGAALTDSWIQCVAWKIYHMFGITLGPQSFVVLDSSTSTKFSKHVALHIPVPLDATCSGGSGGRKECLFLNNLAVGMFVEDLIADMLEDAGPVEQPYQANLGENNRLAGCTQVPKPAYSHFWVNNKDGKPMCFADLGVYTRNRLFRLFGSCKFGKNACLSLSRADKSKYWRPSASPAVSAAEASFKPASTATATQYSSQLQAKIDRAELTKLMLEASYIVPVDLFLNAPLPPAGPQSTSSSSISISSGININVTGSIPGTPTSKHSDRGDAAAMQTMRSELDCDLSTTQYNKIIPEEFLLAVDVQAAASGPTHGTLRGTGSTSQQKSTPQYMPPASALSTHLPILQGGQEQYGNGNVSLVQVDPLSFNREYACLYVCKSRDGGGGAGCSVGYIGEFPQNVECQRGNAGAAGINERVDDPSVWWLSQAFLGNPSTISAQGLGSIARNAAKGASPGSTGAGTGVGRHLSGMLGSTNGASSKEWHDRQLLSSDRPNAATPFVSVDEFVRRFITRPDSKGVISSWKVYGLPSQWQMIPSIRIRYQIGNNRWCQRIRRQHKSNQIILEVDVLSGNMVQSCWDPECRGYRSPPIPLPVAFLPPLELLKTYQDLYIDNELLRMADEIPNIFS